MSYDSSSRRSPFLSRLLQWLLVLWALALVLYFEVREGLIRWPFLFEPETGASFFRDRGLPDPRFVRPPVADAPVAPYVEILKNLFAPYNIHWDNAPWLPLTIAFGMICAYTLLGWMIVGAFRVFMPIGARLCLALTFGCGAVGIAGEGLGLANRLTQPWVAGMWGGFALLCIVLAIVRYRRRDRVKEISMDTRITLAEQQLRARDWFYHIFPPFTTVGQRVLMAAFVLLFSLISFFVLLHAVGEPVSYWDSLILYVGYAREMYLQGGFPLKVVGQVGVGLGANYPHLFEVLVAQTAALSGFWSDTFAQLLPPVATTAALVLVYYTALELTRNRLISMAAALLTRAVPYGLSYSQFASNYSLAILFTAAFIYLAVRMIRDGLSSYRHLMLLVAAGAVHINYLMWGLWPVAALAVLLTHWRYRPLDKHSQEWQQSEPGTPLPVYPPDFMAQQYRPTLFQLLRRREFWLSGLIALALASPWYVRNTIVTGNPVYAFYSNIFPSRNVNPDVMKSAEREWMLNGDGLANVGDTLGEKLAGSWLYFVTGNQHWKLSPVFMGFVMPGFILWALWWVARVINRRRRVLSEASAWPDALVFRSLAVVAALFILLWFYAYVVADFYLYQIIVVLPLFGLFIAVLFLYCQVRSARAVLYGLTLLVAVAPGLVMSVMGFKLKKTGVYENMPAPQFAVTAIRQLFMPAHRYYRMEYGGDMDMIFRVNTLPEGTIILTHENRHLLLNPEHKIIHLDDWEVQSGYGKSVAERVRLLDRLGVDYYWYVPNESRHIANSWLAMEDLIREGYFTLEFDTPSPDASNRDYPQEIIPRDMNSLYQRTDKQP